MYAIRSYYESLGLSAKTTGVKAVAVLTLPDSEGSSRLTVFMSHPIYGVSWIRPDAAKPVWTDLNDGLERVPTIKWPDEVSDLSVLNAPEGVTLYARITSYNVCYTTLLRTDFRRCSRPLIADDRGSGTGIPDRRGVPQDKGGKDRPK